MSTKTKKQENSQDKTKNHKESKNTDVVEAIKVLSDSGCPPFVKKTYHMLEKCESDAITWSKTGKCITIWDPDSLASTVLPRFFKHKNLPSFIRQLNNYGFRKIDSQELFSSYQHPYFLRGRPDLLSKIHIKSKKIELETDKNKELSKLTTVMSGLRGKASTMKKDIEAIKNISQDIDAKFERFMVKRKAAKELININSKKNKLETMLSSDIDSPGTIMKPSIKAISQTPDKMPNKEICQSATATVGNNDKNESLLMREHEKIHDSNFELPSFKSLPSRASQKDLFHSISKKQFNQIFPSTELTDNSSDRTCSKTKDEIMVGDDDTFTDLPSIEDIDFEDMSDCLKNIYDKS